MKRFLVGTLVCLTVAIVSSLFVTEIKIGNQSFIVSNLIVDNIWSLKVSNCFFIILNSIAAAFLLMGLLIAYIGYKDCMKELEA